MSHKDSIISTKENIFVSDIERISERKSHSSQYFTSENENRYDDGIIIEDDGQK